MLPETTLFFMVTRLLTDRGRVFQEVVADVFYAFEDDEEFNTPCLSQIIKIFGHTPEIIQSRNVIGILHAKSFGYSGKNKLPSTYLEGFL